MTEKARYGDCGGPVLQLPKNIFRSYFSWSCYEAARSWTPPVHLTLCGGLLYVWKTMGPTDVWLQNLGVLVIVVCGVGFLPAIYCLFRIMSIGRLISKDTKRLEEAVKEAFLAHEDFNLAWDEVAGRLNRELYLAREWRTPYCFYFSAECDSLFRRYVLKPIFEEKASEWDEKSSFWAAEAAYRKRIDQEYDRAKADNESFAEDTLPADSNRFKAIWRLKTLFKRNVSLCVLIAFLLVLKVLSGGITIGHIVGVLFVLSQGYPVGLTLAPSTQARIRLLATIVSVHPETYTDRWDEVAKRINGYLNRNGDDTGVNRFFDGKDCKNYFEKFIKPIKSGKIKEETLASFELIPFISEALGEDKS